MAGASQVIIDMTLTGSFIFLQGTFGSTLFVDGTSNGIVVTRTTLKTATATLNKQISQGQHTFELRIPDGSIQPFTGSPVGTFNLTFNDTPSTVVNNIVLNRVGSSLRGSTTTTIN